MEGDDLHAPALVELERAEVIVGGDQPEPCAACSDSGFTNRIEKRSSNAASFAEASE